MLDSGFDYIIVEQRRATPRAQVRKKTGGLPPVCKRAFLLCS
jgi:hypothetical protein